VDKDLVYVGKAGTGFTTSMILELARLLRPITLARMPLSKKPDRKNKIDHWAAPKYWSEVEYRDITTDGLPHVPRLISNQECETASCFQIQMIP
jgi:ATP-dependent DNA ligase